MSEVLIVARKRTKAEALKRLGEAYDVTSGLPKGGKRGSQIHELAYLGAAGLIMLDPFNRLADSRRVLPFFSLYLGAIAAKAFLYARWYAVRGRRRGVEEEGAFACIDSSTTSWTSCTLPPVGRMVSPART